MTKSTKKYAVITKVDNTNFVKYRCTNLISYQTFIDKKFPNWRYTNVYDKKTREQLFSFTSKDRL